MEEQFDPQTFFEKLDALYDAGPEAVESFLTERASALTGVTAERLAVLSELAGFLRGRGRLEEAISRFQETEPLITSLCGDRSPERASFLCNLATAYRMKGDTEKAQMSFEEALGICDAIEPGPRIVAGVHNNLAALHREQGRLEEALRHHLIAISRLEGDPSCQEELAITRGNLASVLDSLGRFEEADAQLEESLRLYESLPQESVHYAAVLNTLAVRLAAQGEKEKALELFVSAADKTKAVFSENRDYAVACRNAARLSRQLCREEEAAQWYVRALKAAVSACGRNSELAEEISLEMSGKNG